MNNSLLKDKIWFLGRGYEEYVAMFALSERELIEKTILDCAAGASSFVPRLIKLGSDAIAVDSMYGQSPEALERRCEEDFSTLMTIHDGLEKRVDWDFFPSNVEMVRYRRSVTTEFIAAYCTAHGTRFIHAELPYLPFPTETFDLVLCSHLLFLYEDRLPYQFHIDAIREMLRVSRGEVRIYPIVKLRGAGERSTYVDRIVEDLSPLIRVNFEKVPYKFRRGADEMMRINRS